MSSILGELHRIVANSSVEARRYDEKGNELRMEKYPQSRRSKNRPIASCHILIGCTTTTLPFSAVPQSLSPLFLDFLMHIRGLTRGNLPRLMPPATRRHPVTYSNHRLLRITHRILCDDLLQRSTSALTDSRTNAMTWINKSPFGAAFFPNPKLPSYTKPS